MRNRFSSSSRKHQLVLSLSPHCLHMLHFQRGLLGWRRTHEDHLPLSDRESFLAQLQEHISKCVLQWKIPRDTRVLWVLASDILGIIPPTDSSANPTAALPFGSGDTRTSPDHFTENEQPSLMWIHKDWVAEIERISGHCRLELVELYARAQLFQRQAAQLPGPLKVVLEQHDEQIFLHIYSATGMMLRSRALEGRDASMLRPAIASELAALATHSDSATNASVPLLACAPLISRSTDWQGFACHELKQVPHTQLLEQLWRSDLEGIVVRATHDDLVQSIKLLSMAMGVSGLLGLGLMVFHDGKLQQQIEQGKEQTRKDRPKVAAAKALKSQTLQMADAIQAVKTLQEKNGTMTAFAQILAHFPPPPATLLYVRTEEVTLAFAGSGNESSVKWLQERTFEGYEPLHDLPIPEFLESSAPIIHFQSRKQRAKAAPTPADSTASKAP